MNYGLYMSASGSLTAQARLDVMANNLANMTTAAFKPDRAGVQQRDPARVEDRLPFLPSDKMLERLGAGVLLQPTRPDLTPGAVEDSRNPLDVAIEGRGFMLVDTGKGRGDERLRLSRDGRLTLNPGGTLVRVVDGRPVLDDRDAPITLDRDAQVNISPDGRVIQNDAVVATLAIVSPRDERQVRKAEGGLFTFSGGRSGLEPGGGAVRQHAVERSGVDPFRAVMGVTRAASAIESNARMIQLAYETIGRAVNTLGRTG